MSPEMTPDMEWATECLNDNFIVKETWDFHLRTAGKDISGLHQMIALILIARGLENRPIGKVIEKLKKEGGNGLGVIDSARNR